MPQSFAPLTTTRVKPGQVDNPIPGQQEAQDQVDEFADFDIPEVTAQPEMAAEGGQPPANEFADFGEPAAQADLGGVTDASGQQFEVEPNIAGEGGFSTDNIASVFQQLRDFPDRVAVGLAGSKETKRQTLENRIGKENVKMTKNGDLFFRRNKDAKFKKFDPDTVEMVNDIFGDEFREVLKGSGATIGGGLGVAASIPTAIPTGGMSAVTLPMVGAGVGAGIGNQAATMIGQLLGTVRTPEEATQGAQATGAAETVATFAAFEGVMGRLSNYFKGKAAARQISKARHIENKEILDESSKQALKTLEEMHKAGFSVTIPEGTLPGVTGELTLPANAIFPHVPGVAATAKSLETDTAFQLVRKNGAEQLNEWILQHAETASGTAKGSLGKLVAKGFKNIDGTIAKNARAIYQQVRSEQGAVINFYRKQVKGIAGKVALPVAETEKALISSMDDAGIKGIKNAKGKLVLKFPSDDQLIADMGFTNNSQLKIFKKDMNKIAGDLSKEGGLNIDDLIRLGKTIGNQSTSAKGLSKSIQGRLASALRADTREGMATILDPLASEEYKRSIAIFKQVAKSGDDIKNLLKDDMGSSTFMSGLLSKANKSPEALRTVKALIMREDPTLWKRMVTEFMEEAAVASRDTAPNRLSQFNAKVFEKKVFGIGKENLETLFGEGSDISIIKLKSLLELGKRSETLLQAGAPDTALAANTQKIIQGAAAFSRQARVNAMGMIMRLFDKDARIAKMITREGFEKFLVKVPQAQKGEMRKALETAIAMGKHSGALAKGQADKFVPTVKRAAGGEAIQETLFEE